MPAKRAAGILRAGGDPSLLPRHRLRPRGLSQLLTETLRRESQAVAAVVAVGGDGWSTWRGSAGHAEPAGRGPALRTGAGGLRQRPRTPPRCALPGRGACRGSRAPWSGPALRRTGRSGVEVWTEPVTRATAVCLGLDARINARANRWSRARVRQVRRRPCRGPREPAGPPLPVELTSPDGSEHTAGLDLTLLTLAQHVVDRRGPHDRARRRRRTTAPRSCRRSWNAGPVKSRRPCPRLWLGSRRDPAQVAVEPGGLGERGRERARHRHIPGRDMAFGDGERLGPAVTLRVLPAAVQILF
ncbi:hypothetical protein QJS66_23225 [Kocuria rhizophila]|nr:hypothetical protein QJS66_23225 [Kocuria rhizophila]